MKTRPEPGRCRESSSLRCIDLARLAFYLSGTLAFLLMGDCFASGSLFIIAMARRFGIQL